MVHNISDCVVDVLNLPFLETNNQTQRKTSFNLPLWSLSLQDIPHDKAVVSRGNC